MHLGTNEDEAKVFVACAVPQGLCENLINAHKLLANLQTDGDSPIQNIIMGLKERLHCIGWGTCVEASGF